MKKSVLFKRIVLALILIGVIVLASCSFRGCGKEEPIAEISKELEIVEELFVDVEQDYIDENGTIAIEETPELIDAVYEEIQKSESVTYCEKNDFSVYMILDNGIGFHYMAPVDGIASSGSEIAIYSYQPYHDAFNRDAGLFLGNLTDGEYPDEAVKSLLNLSVTASVATKLENENVTIESLKNLQGDSVILWIGHGGYSSKYSSTLYLYIPYTDELYRKYKDDFDNHRLEIGYVEGMKSVCVTSLFFDKYLAKDALENSIIYLGACHSGEDTVLADSLLRKGASTVYVNSDTIYQKYNNNMCRSVIEALSEEKTVNEALEIAKNIHGEKDNVLFGILTRDTVVYYVGDGDLTLNNLYQRIVGISNDYSNGLQFALNDDGASYSVTGIGTRTDTDIIISSTYNGKPVTSIAEAAFAAYNELIKITIPDSVISIGNDAFNGCHSLTSIVIPDSVKILGEGAFSYCSSLEYVSLPNSIMSIGDYTFYGCDSLTNIVIPELVTSIGYAAFDGCSFENIIIPNIVTSIGTCAFFRCDSLTSIVIPDSVTSIGDYTFYGCDSLTNITFEGTVKEWKAITKGERWNGDVPATEVICSDGTVTLE